MVFREEFGWVGVTQVGVHSHEPGPRHGPRLDAQKYVDGPERVDDSAPLSGISRAVAVGPPTLDRRHVASNDDSDQCRTQHFVEYLERDAELGISVD